MKKRFFSVLVMAVAFVLAFAACSGDKVTDGNVERTTDQSVSANETDTSEETTRATAQNAAGAFGIFETVDINGNTVDNTALQGKKVTMVNVWATFCTPCIGEMPDLQKISKDYADKDFQIVGIVYDVTQNSEGSYLQELLDEAEAVISQTGVTYLNLLMSNDLAETELGTLYSVPTTYFLDENGNQLGESYIGSRDYDDWCQIIDGLLAK